MRADTAAGTVGFEVQKKFCTAIEIPRAIARSYTFTTFRVIWVNQPKTPSIIALEKLLSSGDRHVDVSLLAPESGIAWNRDLGVLRNFHRGM
jgi:hypothetical protein